MTKLIYASTKNKDMLYAVKVEITDPFFLIDTGNKKYVFLDNREFGLFEEKNNNPNIENILLDPLLREAKQIERETNLTNKLAFILLKKYGLTGGEPIGVSWNFPTSMADFLRSEGVELTLMDSFYPERAEKSSEEVNAIKESILKIERVFEYIRETLSESTIQGEELLYKKKILTSELLKGQVERLLLEEDMVNDEGIIISSGLQTAIPHHPGEGPIKANQPIVCDIFPKSRSTGYFADITRTFVKGEPSSELQSMYEAVLKAQAEGVKAVGPGVKTSEVHKICSQVFIDSGYDVGNKGFTHATGHGVGLDVHEKPRLESSSEAELKSGNVVTVEPGLYYPKIGGIRIEDTVLVTKNGRDSLSGYPKDWIIT